MAELRARRDDWGKWTPLAPPAQNVRPDYDAAVPLPSDVPARKKRRWTREECVAAIASLLDELASARLTQRVYQERARGRRDLPAMGSIQRHGTFTELLAEARVMATRLG